MSTWRLLTFLFSFFNSSNYSLYSKLYVLTKSFPLFDSEKIGSLLEDVSVSLLNELVIEEELDKFKIYTVFFLPKVFLGWITTAESSSSLS